MKGQSNSLSYQPVDIERVLDNVRISLVSGQFSLGPNTQNAEACWPQEGGEKNSIVVATGTTGLQLIWRVLDKKRTGIFPEMTVPMNRWAYLDSGMLPGSEYVVDVDDHLCADIIQINELVDQLRDKAAVCYVATGGLCDQDIHKHIAQWRMKGAFVIVDMSHAHGVSMHGRGIYDHADAAVWSFYSTKVLTSGEGGVVWFRDSKLSEKAKIIANQGKKRGSGNFEIHGMPGRLSDISAAMMYWEMLNSRTVYSKRQSIAAMYDDAGIPGLHRNLEGYRGSFYKYVVPTAATKFGPNGADALSAALLAQGVHVTGRVHGYDYNNGKPWRLPKSRYWGTSHVCLPVGRNMNKEDVERVVSAWQKVT